MFYFHFLLVSTILLEENYYKWSGLKKEAWFDKIHLLVTLMRMIFSPHSLLMNVNSFHFISLCTTKLINNIF